MEGHNEYDVTAYVTVAVTAHGIKADSPAHAAMTWGVALAEALERDRLLDLEFSFRFRGDDYGGNAETPDGGQDIESYRVFDGEDSTDLDANGNELSEDAVDALNRRLGDGR